MAMAINTLASRDGLFFGGSGICPGSGFCGVWKGVSGGGMAGEAGVGCGASLFTFQPWLVC